MFDPRNEDCRTQRETLIRAATGEPVTPGSAAEAHLRLCAACRRWLDSSRQLSAALQTALRPEPISEGTRARIAARLDHLALALPAPVSAGTMPGGHARWRRCLRVAGAAAAACLLGAVLTFWQPWRPPATTPPLAVKLSPQEAEAVFAAYSRLEWSGPTDICVNVLAERVDDLARALTSDRTAAGTFPWAADDDWDWPTDNSQSSRIKAGQPRPALLAAARQPGTACACQT